MISSFLIKFWVCYFTTLSVIKLQNPDGEITDKLLIGRDLEGGYSYLNKILSVNLPGGPEEKLNSPVKIAGVLDEIRTVDLPNSGRRALLLEPNCSIRQDAPLSFTEADNIRLFLLPPNVTDFSTRRLFKNLMSDYNTVCSALIRNHLGRDVTKLIFVSLFAQAQGRAASVSTGRNGSGACAVCARNKHGIPEAAMAGKEAVLCCQHFCNT
jgi:hypothetical protein